MFILILFSGTIRENVCLGLGDVDDDKLYNALEIANAKSFVSKLPLGVDTDVSSFFLFVHLSLTVKIKVLKSMTKKPITMVS